MSFSNMLQILQEKNKEKIVLIKLGVFYVATGRDAIFLSKEFGFKCVCFKKQICKIGIPETRIEHYLYKLQKLNIAYIVYHFKDKNQILVEKFKNDGEYHKIKDNNKNCLICKGIRCYDEDKYMNAVKKLMDEEMEQKWQS